MCERVTHAYNGRRAAKYAVTYAKNRNPNYPSFRYDCTNFVSQCVSQGGISPRRIPTTQIKYNHIGDI